MIDGKAEGHRIVQVAQLNETDWQLVVAKG